MDNFREILFDVWREACRHIEISEAAGTITGMLAHHMPLHRMVVRRLDTERCCLETVADIAPLATPLASTHRNLSAGDMAALQAWADSGGRVSENGPRLELRGAAAFVLPGGIAGDTLAGALRVGGEVAGALVLEAMPGHRFEPRHREMAQVLLEPFAAALENDTRLREVRALREAAEADRQSLLARLGRKTLDDVIVGAEGGLHSVMERVELVARSEAPVLILGETGTGKELVARAIHARSPRASGPVIRVNCGAMPPELIDSELFGHDRGAFTGAFAGRKGWFERADGGTLFLDEIGELPPAAQVRLLRILQDGWLERVGGREPVHVDVRIVAATHQDLAAMAAEGRFREDLWYRIAVFPILLPPLRERKEDIPAMARHFAQKASVRFGLPALMPDETDIALLQAYAWPGNVRELGTVVDRAALLGNGERLEIAKALGIIAPPIASPNRPDRPPAAAKSSETFPSLDEATRRHIELALVQTHGRVEGPYGAAALLEINPHTLRARMRKLRIDWTRFRATESSRR